MTKSAYLLGRVCRCVIPPGYHPSSCARLIMIGEYSVLRDDETKGSSQLLGAWMAVVSSNAAPVQEGLPRSEEPAA